ncbi:hypothetical protein PUN28_016564 [Cardiocondyla obscurior]|uniref:Metallo-beta-lactamase domain-containing protein 1 n=1 Tax=Cardiocondyla obscurior TaxID=286306 RepID=A0AAW2ERK5_9HYME
MCEIVVLFDGFSRRLDNGDMHANCSCVLIKGPKLIVVDTMTAWDSKRLTEALTRHNVKPEDVDYVVCTHSHSDHIGNNNLFLNATHIVGLTVQRNDVFYEKPQISNEDYELCQGVKITATPGHTADDITILVDTIKDKEPKVIAITGDLFEKQEDISQPTIWKSLGTPELLKIQSISRSRIINLADFIIPGHGPMFHVTQSMRDIVNSQIIE